MSCVIPVIPSLAILLVSAWMSWALGLEHTPTTPVSHAVSPGPCANSAPAKRPPAGDSGCKPRRNRRTVRLSQRYGEEANRLRQVDTGCTGRTHGLSARSGGTDRHGRGGRDGMGRRLGGTRLVLDCKCMQMKESDCTHSRTERECVLAVHCAYASKESGIADRGSE